jgi:hypothetical protein
MAWVIFLAVALPLLGILVWLLLDDSIVRIPVNRIGLLLVHGAPTDTVLGPGPHWVPALRRRTVADYPANELAFRAGDVAALATGDDAVEHAGPPLVVTLGDRAEVVVGYTVRFRLDMGALRTIHERFGPDGLWPAVRDASGRITRAVLGEPRFGVDDLFGTARLDVERVLTDAMRDALAGDGFVVTLFALGDIDLGRTGEVVQATVRARLELAREEAEAAMRVARARIDAELRPFVDPVTSAAALRYREVDTWRDLADQRSTVMAAPRPPAAPSPASETAAAAPVADGADDGGLAAPSEPR